jgi:proton-dependent oligopeptide transporter, POT family
MPKQPYLTAPIKTDKMPPGVPYIVGNEAAERFSYYGLRAILMIYMTRFLVDRAGHPDLMGKEEATEYYHHFNSAVYFFTIFGAIISDAFWGKYKTIVLISLLYCLGPLTLAFDQTRTGLFIGLALIALGSGGIKPCVSAHVGDQFGETNKHLLPKVFSWFYFSINFGSFFSTMLTPVLLESPKVQQYLGIPAGPSLAFGLPAILMFLATLVFWIGRYKFIHIPPAGKQFVKETFSLEGLKSIARPLSIIAFMPIFWSLYDQSSSRWILQAEEMDLRFLWMEKFTMKAAQTHAFNPILVLIFIPLFTNVVYPTVDRVWKMTPLRKISIGFFLLVGAFLVPAYIELMIARGLRPNVMWQFLAYVVLTASEVMVYLTILEFSYTQAPVKMKSLVMSISLLTISIGNLLTARINRAIRLLKLQDILSGPTYYLAFAGMMFVAAVIFIFVAMRYKEVTYLQQEKVAD